MGEDTLIKHPDFALPVKNALLKSDKEYEVVLIDATETPIERPKKTSLKNTILSWKKEKTCFKDTRGGEENKEVICTAFTNGNCHDFRLFKESKTKINPGIKDASQL
ncbi:putative transposase for insertion sequence element IS702 [Holospora elegans E1]|uniref:Putative transposase for insertion sequence element IS702 n=1 Tax=Holospora elegans E1 TaxID=1427503 RepID=A0A023DYT3_9PROT|nr:putative transposase for insertion sequence element IS702 [Holospora elegans E1]